jgi:glycosyltransferase involved in cell wall biosynthesis
MENLIINVCGPTTDYYDSYGKKLCELVRGLTKRGVYVNVVPLRGELVRDNQPADVQALLGKPLLPAVGGIMLGYPTIYHQFPDMVQAGPTVGVTAWESTIPPVGWVEALDRVDAVSVGSQFTRDVLVKAGVPAQRVHVHPLGISEAYQYVERPPRTGLPFTFLTYAGRGRRKGWDVAMLAFWRAFGRDQRYRLVIKARAHNFKFAPQPSNMHVIRQDLTEAELAEFFAAVDCFVFPTRGEGFGLPPREAAATGLPVIVTNWGGTADDLVQWGYPIRYTLAPAWQDNVAMQSAAPVDEREFPPKLAGLGEWAEPDADHLAEQMTHVATGKLIRQQGRQSARRVRELYDWQRFADQVLEVWQRQAAKYPLTGRREAAYRKAGRMVL